MPNTQAPYGFTPYSNQSGGAPNYEQLTRLAQYNAGVIYNGDPVTQLADGTIARSVAGTTQILGIFCGCEYLSVSQKRWTPSPYWPGSDVAPGNYVTCYIISEPSVVFRVQSGTVAAAALADIGANIQFNLGTGNPATGLSGAYVDTALINPATTTLPFRIVGLVDSPPGAQGADPTTPFNDVLVVLNNADSRTLTGQ